jgi:GcrA cell cycle regulator
MSRKAKFKSLLLDKDFEPENPVQLEELNDETCRWPIGHPPEKDFHFCGRKPLEKFPYCKLHVLYAFQPKNAKEEDIITDEDIPKFMEKKIKSA